MDSHYFSALQKLDVALLNITRSAGGVISPTQFLEAPTVTH